MKLSDFINDLNDIYKKNGDLLVVTPTPISTKNDIGADLPPILEVDDNLLIIHSEEYSCVDDLTTDDEIIDIDEEEQDLDEEEENDIINDNSE